MKYFSFTFTIPAPKIVYYNGKRRPYGNLAWSHQYRFLEDLMIKVINPLKYEFIDWVYEFHEANPEIKNSKRLHLHGFCKLQDCYDTEVYKLREDFYNYNSIIRLASNTYKRLSDIQETYYDISFWENYIQKHQDTIAYHSRYRAEQNMISALDNGIIKIDTNYSRYLNSIDEHLETDNLSDSYKFGKFIVEL